MEQISAYRLTVIGAVVVLCLSVGVVVVLGGTQLAAPYLGLVASIAIPGLLGLFKLEQNSQIITALHQQTQTDNRDIRSKLSDLQSVLSADNTKDSI